MTDIAKVERVTIVGMEVEIFYDWSPEMQQWHDRESAQARMNLQDWLAVLAGVDDASEDPEAALPEFPVNSTDTEGKQ